MASSSQDIYKRLFLDNTASNASTSPPEPSSSSSIDVYNRLFGSSQIQPVEQESGFLATIKKSFQDTFDYLELTALGADGAEGNEQEIAGIISDLYSRSQSVSRSVGHQKILEIASKEGKDISDAEGFIDTTYEVLDGAAKFIWGAITEPIGTAEFIASQAGNQAASLAGMGAGAVAGSMFGSTIPIAGTAVGAFVGARAGAGLAGLSIETGAAYYEALNKAGIDISDQQAVIRAISDPDFQRKMYRQGLTKGITIGAVDALTMGVAKFPGTGSGRALTKELAEEGIDITGKNARQGWAEAVAKHEAGDEAVISAFKKYADAPTPKLLGTKRVAIETAGEGLGEALGGLAAFGETSFEDVALEMLGSGGQSVVQASVVNSLSGAKALKEYATKQTISAQARSVSKGESSNIEPSELNEALRLQNEGVGQSVSSKVTEFIGALEESMDTDDLTIADNVRNAQQEQEYPEYRQALQEGLRNVSNSDFVPMFIAVTKEDQAILASGGRLNRPIKGSTSKAAVTAKTGRTSKSGENFGGQDIVLVKVPISNVIMRGDWSKNELVVDSNGIQLAAVPTQQKQADATPVADPLATKLNTQADALERQDVETQLKTEIEKGELESQAVDRSQKDVGSDKREASTKGINKLAQIRDPENYETVEDLQSVVDKNKIPLLAGQKRKRPPLALALNNYRDALEKPESAAVINRVLAPTGYKVSKRKDGVYIVPIDDKPALRVPNTGNREVGQSTVDDYLFWIREEQQKGRPEATEKKQQSLRKEAERASSRKAPRQNVQSIIDNIEQNLVTRDGNEISIDEEGLSNLLDNTDNIEGWSKADKKNLDQYVKSIRREKEVESKPKKTPLSGSTITISQSAGALPSLNKSFKRTGKPKFFDRVRKSLSNKKGNDVILELISKAYRKANPGKIDGEIASVLTLTGKADSAKVAKAYALARMLVTLQPSVTTIRPDNSLAIEKGTLSAFMRFDKVIGGVKENQLVGQIRQVFGEDATYTRINDFELVITNPKLSQINFARRLGRLRGKRNDIKKSELFTAETETLNHNWSKDPTGESIRDEIRRLGFGDILQSLDDRRADYLDIAEEFGATEVAQYRQAPRAPPKETATEDTEAADEAAFSLEGKTAGININDSSQPFTEQILSGEKTIETRDTDSLRPYVGKRVGIVRTGKGKATLVGYATVGEPKVYQSNEEFRADDDKHLVEEGSAFDINGIKYGYPLTDVAEVNPQEISSRGIIAREVPDDEAAFSLAAEDQSSSDSEVGFYFKKDFKNYDSAKFDEGLEFFYLLSDPEQAKEVREKVGDKKFEKIIKSISRVQEARDKFKDIGINVFIYEDVFSTVNGFYQTYYDEADPNKTFGDVHLNISKLKSDYELARTLSHEMAHAVINEKMFRNKSQSDKFFNDVFSDNRASINAWLSTAGAGYVFESKASKAEEWLVWSIESDLAAILTGERKSFSSQIAEIIDRITKILFESLGFKYQREETAQIIKDATSAFINKSPQIEITSELAAPIVFSRKSEKGNDPIGLVPDQIEYRNYAREPNLAKGILVKMTPQEFLSLVPDRPRDSNVEQISDRVDQGDKVAPPWLSVTITKDGLQVTGHEGRGRMRVAIEKGITDEIEVDVLFNKDRVEDFDAIDPELIFLSQTGRAAVDTVNPSVTIPVRRIEETLLDSDDGPLFALEKLTAAQKMQRWVDEKVVPKVQELSEDSQKVKFRLPKGLSENQRKKYKTAVGKFFTANNTELNGDVVVASFPLPVSDQLKATRARNVSTVKILTGKEKPKIVGTGRNGKIKKIDIGNFLQDRTRANGRIAIGDYSSESRQQYIETLADEISYQLSQSDNAIGWYEEKVSNMMEVLGVIYPELNTDKNNEMVMKAFLAITSQGTEVDENIRNAVKQYEHYRETGNIRIWGTGKSIKAMEGNHQLLSNLVQKMGLDETTKFLETPYSVRELKAFDYEVSGELMSYEGRGALVFGPKIGSFYGNLYGHYESLTADLWFSRTWNRISGNLLASANVSKLKSSEQQVLSLLKNVRAVKPHLNGYDRRKLIQDAELRLEWAASVHSAWSRKGYKNSSDELRVIKRYDEVNTQLEDAPRNGEERAFMRSVIEGVRELLKEDGIDINTADAQAVLWYHEKDLYAKLGVADSRSEATDYEQAARRLLAQKRPDLGFDYVLRGDRNTDRAGRSAQQRSDKKSNARTNKAPPEKVEAESLLPIDKPASGGLSASGLRSSLARRFGKNGIAKLEADGILKIVESAADLPAGLIKDEDAAQRARGLFDPKTKTAYLIANRLNDITGPKVLLHEVGTHFGLKRMMGAEQYASLLVELDNGKDTVFKPWFDRIRSDYKGRLVEGSEKFAEEVLAAISEDTSDITLSLRERMIRAVKEFLNQFLGIQFSNQIDAKEIGYLVQGSLRGLMSKNQLASTKLPRYMLMEGGEAQLGIPAIAFPEYTSPTRNLTEEHKQYDIVSAVGVLSRKEELRLRRNMNGMMKVAERAYKKGYKNIDVHFPIVSAGNGITSRYAMFKNTQTGTELVIRMSDHPKDPYVAAGSFPFLSYNNGHKQDVVDLTEIDQAVKLLSSGKLDGINGLQFQFEFGLGDGVAGITKAQTKNLSYEQFLTALRKRSEEQFARIQDNAQAELRSGAVIGEDGPLFSLSKRTPEEQALIDKTAGGNARRSAMEILNDNRSRWAEKATQYWVDAYRPIKNLLGDDANRAWQMMQLSENTGGMLHALLNYGTPKPVYRDGQFDWYETDFSNEGLVDILKDLEGEANDFMAWMVYTRANRLSKEDREQNFTQDEISEGLKLNQGPNQGRMASGRNRRVVYQQAMRKMSKLQESVLDMAMDAGVITPEVRADLGTDFYVPFYREFSEKGKNKVAGPTPAHDFVNIRNVIKRLRGSEENINDALHNMTMNWTSLLSASMKNKAGVVAMQAAEKAGAAVRFTDKKQIAQLEFSKGKSKNEKWDKYVFVLEKGEKVWYEVNDPLVLNAMATLAWGGVDNKSIRVLSTFKRWLTIGVTASPAFKIRNMIRDTLQSVGVGKLSYNIFGNASKGYSAIRDDYLVTADMMMGGAMFRFGYYNDDPAAIRRAVEDIGEGRLLNTPAKARKAMGKLFGWYQEIGDRLENANRASLYMQRKAEVGHLQASFESRDLLNFSSHGRGVAAQVLMASLPFLNARLQGLDKLVRSGKGKEKGGDLKRLLAVVGTVTLASILLRLSYEGDEEYDQLEEWQKETYWPIKIGDEGFFFLPKPFEIGAIASIGERITENFIRGMGDKAFGGQTENIGFISKYTRDRIFEVLVHQLALDARPQIMKPVFELWQNKDAFTDRQIENLSWQMTNLPNELRARPYTSELALRGSSLLGDVTEYLSGKRDPDAYLSPVQIDHLIKGYFGWLGATTVGLSEVFFSGDEVKPLKRVPDDLRGLVPIGSFWSSFPPRNNKHMTLFYEQMNEAVALKAAYDGYKRQFKYEEAVRVVTDNMDTFRWVKTYNKANDSIQKINKAISFIYETDTMTPKEKRDKLDELNQSKVDIAKAINFSRAEIDQSENIPSRFPLPSLRSPE